MRFRSRPSEVEAVQWTGSNYRAVQDFVAGAEQVRSGPVVRWHDWGGQFGSRLEVLAGKDGAQGWVPVPQGHWLVRNPGDHGDYWPVYGGYFEGKYEPAGE